MQDKLFLNKLAKNRMMYTGSRKHQAKYHSFSGFVTPSSQVGQTQQITLGTWILIGTRGNVGKDDNKKLRTALVHREQRSIGHRVSTYRCLTSAGKP